MNIITRESGTQFVLTLKIKLAKEETKNNCKRAVWDLGKTVHNLICFLSYFHPHFCTEERTDSCDDCYIISIDLGQIKPACLINAHICFTQIPIDSDNCPVQISPAKLESGQNYLTNYVRFTFELNKKNKNVMYFRSHHSPEHFHATIIWLFHYGNSWQLYTQSWTSRRARHKKKHSCKGVWFSVQVPCLNLLLTIIIELIVAKLLWGFCATLVYCGFSICNRQSKQSRNPSIWTKVQLQIKNCDRAPGKHSNNKKVLLRERKRHTDRGVSSTPSLTWGEVPLQPGSIGGGTRGRILPRHGTLLARSNGGPPTAGTTPCQVWWGHLRWGTSPGRGTTQQGYPPGQVWWGYPRWGTPQQGYPLTRSNGGCPRWGAPSQVWQGVPKVGYAPAGVPPRPGPMGGTQSGVTPLSDLAEVPLPSGPGRGTLPKVWTDRWTNTCQNITFPSYYVRGR